MSVAKETHIHAKADKSTQLYSYIDEQSHIVSIQQHERVVLNMLHMFGRTSVFTHTVRVSMCGCIRAYNRFIVASPPRQRQ